MRLPAMLTDVDLPLAELDASRLDGELYRVGDFYSPVDELDGPPLRAAALARGQHPRVIAERLSAAWVHGALPVPPARHTWCVRVGARVGRRALCPVREVVLDDSDLMVLAGLTLTTPMRTALDVARCDNPAVASELLPRLAAAGGFSLAECAARLRETPRLPNKTVALRRLRVEADHPAGQPAETR